MARDIIIYNNFYIEPDKISNAVDSLGFTFGKSDIYSAEVSVPIVPPDIIDLMSSITSKELVPSTDQYYGHILHIEKDQHVSNTTYADWCMAVCIDDESLFSFYRHKEKLWDRYPGNKKRLNEISQEMADYGCSSKTEFDEKIINGECKDLKNWTVDTQIPLFKNRAILFRPDMWHKFIPVENTSKIQLFFANESDS